MTREEILAVTLEDTKGCEAINKAVHEKLGLCWHEWDTRPWVVEGTHKQIGLEWHCRKCKEIEFAESQPNRPDYTQDIKAAWAIKEWVGGHPGSVVDYDYAMDELTAHITRRISDLLWASPLDRCKAFLLMEET